MYWVCLMNGIKLSKSATPLYLAITGNLALKDDIVKFSIILKSFLVNRKEADTELLNICETKITDTCLTKLLINVVIPLFQADCHTRINNFLSKTPVSLFNPNNSYSFLEKYIIEHNTITEID